MSEAQNAQGNGSDAGNSSAEAANQDAQNNQNGGAQGDSGDQGGQGDGGQQQQSNAPAKGTDLGNIDVDQILSDAEKANSGAGDDDNAGGGDDNGGQGGQGQGDDDQNNGGQQGAGDDDQQQQGQGDDDKGGQDDKNNQQGADEDLGDWKSITALTVDQTDIKPDDKYGIAPIDDLPDPEKFDGNYNDFFKKEMLPRITQAVANVVGLRQKAYDQGEAKATQQKTEAEQQRADGWVKDIDALVKDNSIPKYTVDKDGKLDANSEGGKVVLAVFEYMNKLNENKPENQRMYDFKLAHKLWKADQAEQQQQQNDQKDRNNRREQSRRIAGSTQNNQSKPTAAPGLRKGMTLDDIEIE